MYVDANNACNMQSGETPLSPAFVAGTQATCAAADAAVDDANANWNSVVSRNWQSFASLGPYVAFQLRDGNQAGAGVVSASPDSAGPVRSVLGTSPPIGINLISQGNPDGSNPAAGGSSGGSGGAWVPDMAGGSMWRPGPGPGASSGAPGGGFGRNRSGKGARDAGLRSLSPSDRQFIETFGLPPVKTLTGSQPDPGSVGSLVYGGAGRSNIVGPGKYAAATPRPAVSGYPLDCSIPGGVSMVPVGEPIYPGGPSGDVLGAGGGLGVGGTLLALVALAGLAFLADRSDKKSGRTKA